MALFHYLGKLRLPAISQCMFPMFVLSVFLNLSCGNRLQVFQTSPSDFDNITTTCEAFFYEYVTAAGNFTHCELFHAKPYRICTKCFESYAIMRSLYNDLTSEPKLHDCMIKYLKSDRVQIIPTMQRSADSLWDTSDCNSCIRDLQVDKKTKDVTFTVPDNVQQFISLYTNMSQCLQEDTFFDYEAPSPFKSSQNVSILCTKCNDSYHNLNDHYNSMASDASGKVCMDVVDMMNYTRVAWSAQLNCSHRSADAATVIIITIAVAVSPLFFYLPLRYTSKVKINRVFKQKRFVSSYDSICSTPSPLAQSNGGRRATPLSQIAS